MANTICFITIQRGYRGIRNKDNFINKLMKNSHVYLNAFGYGETYSTTYGFNTGQNIYKTNCDSFQILTHSKK